MTAIIILALNLLVVLIGKRSDFIVCLMIPSMAGLTLLVVNAWKHQKVVTDFKENVLLGVACGGMIIPIAESYHGGLDSLEALGPITAAILSLTAFICAFLQMNANNPTE